MRSQVSHKELEVLSQITLDNFRKRELYWLKKLLIAQNSEYEIALKEALAQQSTSVKEHLFDILNNNGTITYDIITTAWKLIIERLEECDSIFADKFLLDKKIVEIDIDKESGEYCIYTKGEWKLVEPIFFISLDEIYKNDKLFVIGTKNDIEELEVRKKRAISKDDSNTFTFLDIVKDALAQNTSDIHINYGKYYTVHFRIDGILILQKKYTMDKERYEILINEIAQKASKDTGIGFDPDTRNLPQQGKIDYKDLNLRLRLQFTPKGNDGEVKVVDRLIKLGVSIGNIDNLQGYDENFINMLRRATLLTTGLILIAGVTNSGKSFLTSHFLMSVPEGRAIVTAEDPIEYGKPRADLTQHQTFSIEKDGKVVAKVGFLEYMKAWKRSDPDVTEIGEMREDEELVDTVVSSVKAGNLVVSTIHINSVYDVPNALVTTFGMDKYVISDILRLLVNQVLVPKLCPHCKLEDTQEQNAQVLEDFYKSGDIRYKWTKPLEDFLQNRPLTYIKNPKGCKECGYKGTKGLVPIYEFLKFDVPTSEYFSKDFLDKSKFEIEEYFCKRAYEEKNPQLATNKLSTYITALIRGDVDTDLNTATKVLL